MVSQKEKRDIVDGITKMYRDAEVEWSLRVLGVHAKAYLIKTVLYGDSGTAVEFVI